jgi:hypothetical protein
MTAHPDPTPGKHQGWGGEGNGGEGSSAMDLASDARDHAG